MRGDSTSHCSSRSLAHLALREWSRGDRFADELFHNLAARASLPSRDRAFALELFYGVLRNLTRLDFSIGLLRQGPLQAEVRDLLRLGLYQLWFLETAPHAAVNETVGLAPARSRPVVNGILREALRKRDRLNAAAETQPLSVRMSHPAFLVARWEKQFGPEQTEALCHWNNQPAPVSARNWPRATTLAAPWCGKVSSKFTRRRKWRENR